MVRIKFSALSFEPAIARASKILSFLYPLAIPNTD